MFGVKYAPGVSIYRIIILLSYAVFEAAQVYVYWNVITVNLILMFSYWFAIPAWLKEMR